MIKEIRHNEDLIALIIFADYKKDGIEFFTENESAQQIGYMQHPAGKVIAPHVHNKVTRQIDYTQETLVIRKGKLKASFYDQDKNFLEAVTVGAGDILFLSSGGHGFEVIEDIEMFEIKQGPYVSPEQDKTRF